MTVFDVAIIGVGIVGCATARHLTLKGYNVVLIDKGNIAGGASSGNSGIVHTGFDATAGTLEHTLILKANLTNKSIYTSLGLPFKEVGCLVVAWSQQELEALVNIQKSSSNTIETRLLNRQQLLEMEPFLNPCALGVHVPKEALIDPWLTAITFAAQAAHFGAQICLNSKVVKVIASSSNQCKEDSNACLIEEKIWTLILENGTEVKSRSVINCGGLYGDHVDGLIDPQPSFTIHPRKGQFAVFDKQASKYLTSIICPVPTERTKGVFLFPTVYGNVLVGPTAEDQLDRVTPATTNSETIKRLIERAHFMVPKLKEVSVIGEYAGLRPATLECKDYIIKQNVNNDSWITVGGIRSTGVTASSEIANYVENEFLKKQLQLQPTRTQGFNEKSIFSVSSLGNEFFSSGNNSNSNDSDKKSTSLRPDKVDGLLNGVLPVSTLTNTAYVGKHLEWSKITHPITLFGVTKVSKL